MRKLNASRVFPLDSINFGAPAFAMTELFNTNCRFDQDRHDKIIHSPRVVIFECPRKLPVHCSAASNGHRGNSYGALRGRPTDRFYHEVDMIKLNE